MKKTAADFVATTEGFATITLSRPLDVAGAKVATLTMREPTVRDQRAMELMAGGAADQEVGLFANLCGLAPADFDGMPMRDYARVQAAYRGFID